MRTILFLSIFLFSRFPLAAQKTNPDTCQHNHIIRFAEIDEDVGPRNVSLKGDTLNFEHADCKIQIILFNCKGKATIKKYSKTGKLILEGNYSESLALLCE